MQASPVGELNLHKLLNRKVYAAASIYVVHSYCYVHSLCTDPNESIDVYAKGSMSF